MLQQTQAHRVIAKYNKFIQLFPTVESLAKASNIEVLRVWQGLGYNRRALFLKKSAEIICEKYTGKIPRIVEKLTGLPGIGYSTACAIATFAYNIPTVFIETNIRTVFIHFFFKEKENVSDQEILELVTKTVDKNNPRDWYYALMDYGVFLKKKYKNPSRKSKSYSKQSRFEGSKRQLRGNIVKLLLEKKRLRLMEIDGDLETVKKVMEELEKEKLIKRKGSVYTIA